MCKDARCHSKAQLWAEGTHEALRSLSNLPWVLEDKSRRQPAENWQPLGDPSFFVQLINPTLILRSKVVNDMECLDIPVDHRLLHIIKELQFPAYSETSDHLKILKEWGDPLTWDGARLKNTRIHHALELAKPATKGGVLVALLQPHSSQEFDKGFVADVHDCRTTRAVRDLIGAATGGRMGLDDVSVFDTLPMLL